MTFATRLDHELAAEEFVPLPPCTARAPSADRGGGHVGAETRERIVTRLEQLQQDKLTPADVAMAAAGAGVTVRTVERWLARGSGYSRPASPRLFELGDADRQAFEHYAGQVSAVHRARVAAVAGATTVPGGIPIPPFLLEGWKGARPVAERTLYAAFAREVPPAERAWWRAGDTARDALLVYRHRAVTHRNQIWQTDHAQLKIVVWPRRGKPIRPWLTSVIDVRTRVLLGWVLSEQRPTAGTALAALRDAIVCDPAQGGHGGVPQVLECDNGSEFTSDVVHQFAATAGIHVVHSPFKRPHYHGRIERWHLTVTRMLLVHLPGYSGGPRDRHGRLCAAIRDDIAWRSAQPAAGTEEEPGGHHPDIDTGDESVPGPDDIAEGDGQAATTMLGWTEFVDQYARWVRWYNSSHRHRGLGGIPPLRAWRADPTPISTIAPALVRDLLLGPAEKVIGKNGIRHDKVDYVATALSDQVGTTVKIRYAPHDTRFIEVYDTTDRHLATATAADSFTAADTADWDSHRGRDTARLHARRQAAIARARRWDEPVDLHAVRARKAVASRAAAPVVVVPDAADDLAGAVAVDDLGVAAPHSTVAADDIAPGPYPAFVLPEPEPADDIVVRVLSISPG